MDDVDQVIISFNETISNHDLEFSHQATVARRPGAVSSYPAALAPLTASKFSFSVMITETKSNVNFLTLGLATKTFPASSSEGFGRQLLSWGIQCDRSSPRAISVLYSSSERVGETRRIGHGDLLSFVGNITEGWMDIYINLSQQHHRLTFKPGNFSDFVVGVTFANNHTARVIPLSHKALLKLVAAPDLMINISKIWPSPKCRDGHSMKLCTVSQYTSQSPGRVTCDLCGMEEIASSGNIHFNCLLCNFDTCLSCSMPRANSSPVNMAVLTGKSPIAGCKQGTTALSQASVSSTQASFLGAFSSLTRGSPSWVALEQLLFLVRRITSLPINTELNSDTNGLSTANYSTIRSTPSVLHAMEQLVAVGRGRESAQLRAADLSLSLMLSIALVKCSLLDTL